MPGPLRLIIAVVAVAALGACSSSTQRQRGGPLRAVNEGGGMAAAGLPVKAGLPYEMPVRDLCTATGAPIAIDNVKLWDEKGSMRLVDWGVRAQRPNRPVGPNIGGE